MVRNPLLECTFLIPVRRDAKFSDGQAHDPAVWDWLDQRLFDLFEGGTLDRGLKAGFYRDPDTHERVEDESYKFTVALPRRDLSRLRSLLRRACVVFAQKCIYLSIAGHVEFIEAKIQNPGGGLR